METYRHLARELQGHSQDQSVIRRTCQEAYTRISASLHVGRKLFSPKIQMPIIRRVEVSRPLLDSRVTKA
jgi:hypothetical protein